MKIYYRISDKSYNKAKLPGTNKEFCLRNFTKIFKQPTIIADNCTSETVNMCKSIVSVVRETSYGNAGALREVLRLAIELKNKEIVYFVEDDYIHFNNKLKNIIKEGLTKADYITLYDHPDKYEAEYNYGEDTKLFKTNSSHWKYSISTTMTFATTVKTLKEDQEIWSNHISGVHPNDHFVFCELKEKGRKLACVIPGLAYHTDLTYFEGKGKVYIEPWALKLVEKELSKNIDKDLLKTIKKEKNDLNRLMMLESANNL